MTSAWILVIFTALGSASNSATTLELHSREACVAAAKNVYPIMGYRALVLCINRTTGEVASRIPEAPK